MVFIYSLGIKTGFSNKLFYELYPCNHTLKHVGMRIGSMVRYCGVRFLGSGAGAGAVQKNIRFCLCETGALAVAVQKAEKVAGCSVGYGCGYDIE